MTHDIIVTVYQTYRSGETDHSPKEYSAFTGVSMLSTRPEGITAASMLNGTGWIVDTESRYRKAVKIELPESVKPGAYTVDGVKLYGLHSDYAVNDGMGKSVYAYCNPVEVADSNVGAAIDATVQSGIMLSVPQESGNRSVINAKVVNVSELYTDTIPANWKPEF